MSLTSTSNVSLAERRERVLPEGDGAHVEVGAEDRGEHVADVVFVVGVEDFELVRQCARDGITPSPQSRCPEAILTGFDGA